MEKKKQNIVFNSQEASANPYLQQEKDSVPEAQVMICPQLQLSTYLGNYEPGFHNANYVLDQNAIAFQCKQEIQTAKHLAASLCEL